MALHIKSHKSFIILIAISAFSISAMAATFSVTGIATLFSGYFFTVALMMGVLEFGKIVVASFVARFWQELSKVLKTYFISALTVLILITSGGIFGYLSDAYQKTKGDYTVIEKQVSLIEAKIKLFQSEKERVQNRLDVLTNTRVSQETRLDSLYSRGQITTAKRIELQIESANKEVSQLSVKLNTINDSVGFYETSKVEKETTNLKGELGPLKYIANIFNTDMDNVVKYFIFMLIFVFDPLAVLLFVSINLLIKPGMDNNSSTNAIRNPKDSDGEIKTSMPGTIPNTEDSEKIKNDDNINGSINNGNVEKKESINDSNVIVNGTEKTVPEAVKKKKLWSMLKIKK